MMQESPGLPLSFIKQLHEILERWQALVACCLSDALSSGEIRSDMNNTQLAAIFWSSWEGAVMRAKLYCSTQPVYDFWSYFKSQYAISPLRTRLLKSKKGRSLIIIIKPGLSGFHFISYTELLPGHEFRHSEVFGHIDGITQRINGGQAIQSGLR